MIGLQIESDISGRLLRRMTTGDWIPSVGPSAIQTGAREQTKNTPLHFSSIWKAETDPPLGFLFFVFLFFLLARPGEPESSLAGVGVVLLQVAFVRELIICMELNGDWA